jgi:hypothetical protein
MANAMFTTPEYIAQVAANLVGRDLNLAKLISRDLEKDFSAGTGNAVKIRVPGAVAAQTRSIYDTATPLVSDEIAEQFISVELALHVYDNVVLSEGDLDLEIKDFGLQVLKPQARAIVKHVERAVAASLRATPAATGITYAASTPAKAFTQIRRRLRDNGVTTEAPIVAAVGSSVYADLLDAPVGTFDADGKVRGITVVESTRLAPNEIVAFVREAFTLVVRAPRVPDGAPYGASVTEDVFALRHIRAYDSTVAADRSLLSAFVAVQAMPLAVDNEDGTVSLVANGGAVRLVTGA